MLMMKNVDDEGGKLTDYVFQVLRWAITVLCMLIRIFLC